MESLETPTPAGARMALVLLVVLIVLSPWPFGSVHLRAVQIIAFISLLSGVGAVLWDGGHRQFLSPSPRIVVLMLGLWVLAALQVLPLPSGLHDWLAPGSAWVWHPAEPAAAAVLGSGSRPVSVYPDATRRWLAYVTGVAALTLAATPALRNRRTVLRTATVLVIGGFAVAIYGLLARVFLANRLYGILDVPTVLPFGPFVSKNHFAGYVEMAALLALGLATGLADDARRRSSWLSWVDSPRAARIVIVWGLAAVLILAVPVSLSRGGVVSLAAGLGSFGLLRLGLLSRSTLSRRRVFTAALVCVSIILAFRAVLPDETRGRVWTLVGVTSEQSGAYRLVVCTTPCAWRPRVQPSAQGLVRTEMLCRDSRPRLATFGSITPRTTTWSSSRKGECLA